MAQEGIDLPLAHVAGVLFGAEVFDIADDPIALRLFGAVGVMVITQYLAHLGHEL